MQLPDLIELGDLGVALDLRWTTRDASALAERVPAAVDAMAALESGAVANPDEGRMVGHYWLRAPELAPEPALSEAIREARQQVDALGDAVSGRFSHVLHVGIGGSALGPQLVSDALGGPDDARILRFVDNTDPAGVARAVAGLPLADTLTVVVSKSGGTPETRNGMLLVKAAYDAAGVAFAPRAVAVTGDGSALDALAASEGWLARLPMWDWVGGRTSVTSAVGLVPMRLQGLDTTAFLAGAAAMDAATRGGDLAANPALALAAAWWIQAKQRQRPTMVVLPYADRLILFSRYLQQLVMESLGKRLDLSGREVHEGLAVYGNKGSTDQHAYVQQLRDGRADFFASFVEVLEDGGGPFGTVDVGAGARAGDYLSGFLAGTRSALAEAGRDSITVTVPRVDAERLGALIALYERAVGFYASFVGVNAYHQPGVEAGKKAAAAVLDLQRRLLDALGAGASGTAGDLAAEVGAEARDAFHVLRHLAATGRAKATGSGLGRRFSLR